MGIARSPEDMSLAGRLVMGGLFAGTGIMIVFMSTGVIAVDPASVHAPTWVLLTSGLVFFLPGLWILTTGTVAAPVLNKVVGPLVMVGLMSMLHWVAFGPGFRQCSGGISIPFLSSGGPVGDLGCRLGFGYGALLFDGLIGGVLLGNYADKKLKGVPHRVASGVATTLVVIPLAPLFLLLALKSVWQVAADKLRGGAPEG